MSDEEAGGRRRRLRLPPVVPPLVMTAMMVFAATCLLDDVGDGSARAGDQVETSAGGAASGREREGGGAGTATITMVGDIGSGPASVATLHAMASSGAEVHVALGDLSYAGPGSEQAWCDLVHQQLGDSTPIAVVAGDREEDSGQDGRIANFERCLPDRVGAQGLYGREYYFDVGKIARVILISPGLTLEGERFSYGDGKPNRRWIEAAIDGARDAGLRWVIVGMHKSCISVGARPCTLDRSLIALLIEQKVDLVVSGDDRTYQRSAQFDPTAACAAVVANSFDPACVADDGADRRYAKDKGPLFVISGAGGADLDDIHEEDPERGYFAAVMGRNSSPRNGFLRLRASREELRGEFVGSSPGEFMDAFAVDGGSSA